MSEVSAASAGETASIAGVDVDPFDFSYYMDRVRVLKQKGCHY
jgi:hypothetical protein